MIKDFIVNKIRSFQAGAGSMSKQKDAEKLWDETVWKLALEANEINKLRDGWAKFVVNGNRNELDVACETAIKRLGA